MASGENVLWTVDKSNVYGKVVGRFVFRTFDAADRFKKKKHRNSKVFIYHAPQRATWGPEQ